MSDAVQKELRKFDAERVRPSWEKLVRGQQARFEALKIPAMFVTDDKSDMEVRASHLFNVKSSFGVRHHPQKQRRVANVLEGILSVGGAD